MTYDWSTVGARSTPTTVVPSTGWFVRTDNTIVPGVTSLASKALLVVDGAYNAGITDSVVGGMFEVYPNNPSHVRGYVGHSTVLGAGGADASNGIVGAAYVAEYNDVTADNDGFSPTGEGSLPTIIQYNKIHRDGSVNGTNHHDGIQFWQGGNTTIHRNWISGFQNAAVFIKTDYTAISHVIVNENYLANPTGYWVTYAVNGGKGRPTFIDYTNNKFSSIGAGRPSAISVDAGTYFVHTAAQRQAAIDGGNPDAAAWIVWSGNRWADGAYAGQEIIPPGGWLM